MAAEVMQFLRDWLDKHIHKSDAAYAPYVKNQKVANIRGGSFRPDELCYHGVCLPDNMLASGPPARMFLNPRSPNARGPSRPSAGSELCRHIRESFRDSLSDR
jgi:hypothetical protein